jgi:hypothetical protein
MVDPIFQYAHGVTLPGSTTTCNAITGGAFAPTGLWPAMDGAYLAADYGCGVIVKLTKPVATWGADGFASALGSNSATSLTFGPFGNAQGLYFTTYAGGGQIWVINYNELGNNPPTASGNAAPLTGSAPLGVMFSSSGSSDPNAGDTLTYFWDFGDGTSISTSSTTVMHSYPAVGKYTATLRARDNHFAFSAPISMTIHALSAAPSIDVDADGTYDALTDGLLILRYMFNLTGPPLTDNALNVEAQRTVPGDISAYLDGFGMTLDIDGDQNIDALTDGLMIIRYLFGLRDAALVEGALGSGATRNVDEIQAHLATLVP